MTCGASCACSIPVSAVTQELRERFTRQIYDAGREHLARRLARAFVREVGRAAIDLYGGSLRVSAGRLETHVSAATASRHGGRSTSAAASRSASWSRARPAPASRAWSMRSPTPSRRRSTRCRPRPRFTAYKLTHDGLPAALLIDSPGLAGAGSIAALVQAADGCDMVLWVASAVQAARETDRAAIEAIRAHFAARPHRRQPPMLLVLTQIDRLRPFNEWEPPYDLGSTTRSKAVSIRAAMEAAGAELGFAADDIVPARVDVAVAPYNVDALWAQDHRAGAGRATRASAAQPQRHQERRGLGDHLVASRQCGPRHPRHVPQPEPQLMTQADKTTTDADLREAAARTRQGDSAPAPSTRRARRKRPRTNGKNGARRPCPPTPGCASARSP